MRSSAVLLATLGLAALSRCALAQTLPSATTAPSSSQPATQVADSSAAPATAPSTQAAAPGSSPGSRTLHNFDFEETRLNNYESIPMFWRKVVGRGFPAFAAGAFDHDVFRPNSSDPKARTSFRLDIDSGSAAFRYLAPIENAIHVNPNADYYVIGYVKTTPLQFARAEIRAWYADENGNLLPGKEFRSDRFASSTDPSAAPGADAAEWHLLSLFVPGPHPNTPEANAKTLVLQLGLLQEQQLSAEGSSSENPLGPFALYHQDIKGSAWFDDVVVYQLPRISVEVPAENIANIFEPAQPINLDLTVADLVNHPNAPSLGVSLKITDPDGLVFATEKWDVHTTPEQTWTHHYTHAHLPPALYTATLEVADGVTRTLIARRQTKFLSLADLPVGLNAGGTERKGRRFGITATQWPVECWGELPDIARDTTVGLMQVPAWRRDMSESALHTQDPAFDALLGALQREDTQVLGSFAEMPSVLEDRIAEGQSTATRPVFSSRGKADPLLALADADPAVWRPYASFLLARYSNFVDAWEVGTPDAPFSGALSDAHIDTAGGKNRYPDLYNKMYGQLAGLLSKPRLVIPWNALFDFDIKSYPHAVLDLRIPNVIKPTQITSYVRNFADAVRPVDSPVPAPPVSSQAASAPETPMYIHIEPLEEASYARTDRLSDFAQRVIFARSTNPLAVMIDLPLHRVTPISSGTTHSEPDELLLIYRTLVRTLGTATYRREISISPGVRAFLFVRDEPDGVAPSSDVNHEGILALWNESAADAVVAADLPLGDVARGVEINGFTHPLAVDPKSRLARVNISTVPSLITFVDAHLVELRASFMLSNANLPAGAGVMQTEVHLTNPYSEPLSGNMRLNPPAGWTIDNPTLAVNIPPGGTFTQRITIRYPYTEAAGGKQINATLVSDGDGPGSGGHPLQLSFPVAVKSDAVDTEGFARIMPNGDLVIQQMITNISTVPLNAEAYALVPGYARQQHFVVNLPPGQTTIKRFLFPMSTNVDYTKKMTPSDLSALLANKFASVGLRQNSGKTLITKSFPLN